MANQDDSDLSLSKALADYWSAIKTSRRKDARTEVERYVTEILNRVEYKESRFKMEMVLRDSLFDQTDISEKTCRFDYDLPITQLSIKEVATEIPQDTTTGYTTYSLSPIQKESWKDLADEKETVLSAVKFMEKFKSLVKETIDDMNQNNTFDYKFDISGDAVFDIKFFVKWANERREEDLQDPDVDEDDLWEVETIDWQTQTPVVNIEFKAGNKEVYEVGLTPVIQVNRWPENVTKEWESRLTNGWPSTAVISKLKQSKVYLLPETNGILWQYDFKQGENLLFNELTLFEHCYEELIGIMKGLLAMAAWPCYVDNFEDLKAAILYEFESHCDLDSWSKSKLTERLLSILKLMASWAEDEEYKNYFLPQISMPLANSIEREKMHDINYMGYEEQRNFAFQTDTFMQQIGQIHSSEKVLQQIGKYLQHPCKTAATTAEACSSKTSEKQETEEVPAKHAKLEKDEFADSSWRSQLNHSKDKEGGVYLLQEMLLLCKDVNGPEIDELADELWNSKIKSLSEVIQRKLDQMSGLLNAQLNGSKEENN